jgi:hypothetical protein
LSLRAAFAPTCLAKVDALFKVLLGFLFMLKVSESTNKSGFQFRHDRTNTLLVLV